MRKIFLAGVAALAVAAVPALAKDMPAASATSYAMTPDQHGVFVTWPAERQERYRAWSPAAQAYFWSLSPLNREGFWILTHERRAEIMAMPADQQAMAWQHVAQMMTGKAPPAAKPPAAKG